MTMPATIKYAVYPGSVTLYSGTTATFTALELATLYGASQIAILKLILWVDIREI